MTMNARTIFLDKNGTLIENHPFNRTPDHIRLLPGTVEGLKLLHQAGYTLVVITNQSGIAHGWFTQDALTYEEISLRMRLAAFAIPLAGFYVCPHHPDGTMPAYRMDCVCRKPRPGLLVQAACELGLDLTRSWMVGDILHDVEAGRSAGCKTVLLTNGHETEWEMTPMRWPDLVADNLLEAAHLILVTDRSLMSELQRPLESEED
jgi:D-glycero-D-manno-heptose 1,7-bisphosphate phosphatase